MAEFAEGRTHRDLGQLTRNFAREDLKLSWRLWLETWAVLLVAIVGTLLPVSIWIRGLFSVLMGLTTVRLFIFYHDYLHGALFRGDSKAKIPMWIYGILTLNPPNVWKRSHNYHHQNNAQIATASIGSFPVMTVEQYQSSSLWERALYLAARHPITIFLGYVPIFILGMCLKSYLTDPRRHWDSGVALVVHFAILGLLSLAGWDVVLLTFVIPQSIACGLGAYLFYIQHNFPGVLLKPRTEWTYAFAALHSSSYMMGNPFVHWFTGNIGYHHVHHLNPLIPFYRLPETMAAVPELQCPKRTSLAPWDIYECLRLKLWDPSLRKMIGLREYRRRRHPQSLAPNH